MAVSMVTAVQHRLWRVSRRVADGSDGVGDALVEINFCKSELCVERCTPIARLVG